MVIIHECLTDVRSDILAPLSKAKIGPGRFTYRDCSCQLECGPYREFTVALESLDWAWGSVASFTEMGLRAELG